MVRVLIADDHAIMRQGLRAMLEEESGFEVAGEAGNGREALGLVAELRPDVVIMDVGMPELNGIDATRLIVRDHPGVKVVALSMHSERRFVTSMLEAGASGYVLKGAAFDELVDAVSAVHQGRIFTSQKVTDLLMTEFVRRLGRGEPASPTPTLTPREREVVQLLAEGRSAREIAEHLHISVNTVDTHRRRVLEKLDLSSIAELTKYAIREGLTSLDG